MNKSFLLSFTFFMVAITSFGQSGAFGYSQLNDKQKNAVSSFCLPNQEVYKSAILSNNWKISHENSKWIYFSAKAEELHVSYLNGELPDYYIEYAPPHLLNDSMRLNHQVDPVHNGTGLSSSYKGKDIIIGFVDTGIELAHPDFKDAEGKTRVIRIWDQSVSTGSTPSPYGYGIIWDSTQINAGLCSSGDDSAHGSTVAGAAAGNGNSVGYNHGVAPEADIIMIKTSFNLPNWTMTVADACEYVFKVADSLGKRAVVNLSVGSYLGSHDGRDPAALRIGDLVDEKDGRIVVSACGNSGNSGKYHCRGIVSSDTTFVWFENNPNSAFGPNKVFFDLYSEMSDAAYSYSLKAINPANNYETRAGLVFRPALSSVGVPVFDTLRNATGQRIATVEIYTSQEGTSFHMQVLFRDIDSTGYYYGLYTHGTGNYDLWSGSGLGYNDIIEAIPTPAVLPSILHYHLPDAEQTIVSSWNCSPKVISVGNTRNRTGFENLAGGYTSPSDITAVGQLSPNSSKGPNRDNIIKPDITASGDVILSAGPLWYLEEPANFSRMDPGGWHLGNGGTSMASPVVAGIAALYLERCEKGNHASFKDLIQHHSGSNAYTGTLPNNAYGYGVINAYTIIQHQEFEVAISGDSVLCVGPNIVEIETTEPIGSVLWSNGSTTVTNQQYTAGAVFATVYNVNGCGVRTDTIIMTQSSVETMDPITVSDDFLTLSTNSSNGFYQWTYNGTDIPGETNDTLVLNSIQNGIYDCYTTGEEGCTIYAGGVGLYLSVDELQKQTPSVYPNPAHNQITLLSDSPVYAVQMVDVTGKIIPVTLQGNTIDIASLSNGYYVLIVKNQEGTFYHNLIKQ